VQEKSTNVQLKRSQASAAAFPVPDVVRVAQQTDTKKPASFAGAGFLLLSGAGEMNRTPDLLITNELLYRLSYTG
jgi:hypothetical protein